MKALLFFLVLSLLKASSTEVSSTEVSPTEVSPTEVSPTEVSSTEVSSTDDATKNNTDSNASNRMRCHQCNGKVPEALDYLLLKLSKTEVKDYIREKENYCTGDWIAKYISDAKRCKTNEICYTMTVKKNST